VPLDAQKKKLVSIGNYDLLEKIAEGGMGSVYKGRSWATGEIVAVKIVDVPPLVKKNEVLLRRFQQEFRACSSLNHPNIVRALDYGHEESTHYLVMEYVDGEALGERIVRDGPLPEDKAIAIIIQVAQALERLHERKMVHRDVKPDNILLTTNDQAKLIDLGLVKDVDGQMDLTRAGGGLGTPNFMAPEQFRNAKNANRRCDIYSLAATLYMAVTGKLPYGGCTFVDIWTKKLYDELPAPRSLRPTLSEGVDRAIRRAMSADPARRPGSCRRFVKDLLRGPRAPGQGTSGHLPRPGTPPSNGAFAGGPNSSSSYPSTPSLPSGSFPPTPGAKPPASESSLPPTPSLPPSAGDRPSGRQLPVPPALGGGPTDPGGNAGYGTDPVYQEEGPENWTAVVVVLGVCVALLSALYFLAS
jgi:serine/threonine protein kinase